MQRPEGWAVYLEPEKGIGKEVVDNRPALSIVNERSAPEQTAHQSRFAEHEKHASTVGGGEFSDSQTHAAPDLLAVWLNDPECIPLLLSLLGAGCGCATEPGSFNETDGRDADPTTSRVPDAQVATHGVSVSPISNHPSRQTVQAGRDGQREGA